MNSVLFRIILLLSIFYFIPGTTCAQESATAQLKPAIEQLTSLLADESLQGDENKLERRAQVMAVVKERFDFRLISQLILGKGWRKLTDDEKDYFTELITKFLEHVYIGRLENYPGGEVEFVEENVKDNGTTIVTTAIDYNGEKVNIHYVMVEKDGQWMVYEVKIETFSLVRTYREEFQPILRKKKFEGLVKVIEEKNSNFDKGSSEG